MKINIPEWKANFVNGLIAKYGKVRVMEIKYVTLFLAILFGLMNLFFAVVIVINNNDNQPGYNGPLYLLWGLGLTAIAASFAYYLYDMLFFPSQKNQKQAKKLSREFMYFIKHGEKKTIRLKNIMLGSALISLISFGYTACYALVSNIDNPNANQETTIIYIIAAVINLAICTITTTVYRKLKLKVLRGKFS